MLYAIAATILGTLLPAAVPALPSFAERVDVHQVSLEVFVTDPEGHPVADLAARDFRVFEDGRPIELQSFAWVAGGKRTGSAAAPGGADGATAGPPVRVVLVLDEQHTRAPDRVALYATLARVLGKRLPPGSQVTIWRLDGGVEAVLPFTANTRDLAAALAKAATRFSTRQINSEEEWLSTQNSLKLDATQKDRPCLFGADIARAYAEDRRSEVRRSLGAIGWLLGTLDGLPGRKVVLYVSDGIPLRPGEEAYDTFLELCGGSGAASGISGAKDVAALSSSEQAVRPDPEKLRLEALTYDTSKEWEALAARASGQGVSLYTLVPGGPTPLSSSIRTDATGNGPSALVQGGIAANQLDAVFFMATETGGRLIYNGADLEKDLGDVAQDQSFYLLGYPAPNPGDGHIRRLRVELTRPGLRVRHRRSYALKTDDQEASDQLLTRLYYRVGENPLGLELAPQAPRREDAPRTARLRVTVPLRDVMLVSGGGADTRLLQGMITVYLVSRDAEGNASPVRRRTVPLHFPATDSASLRQRTFHYEVAMPLPKGHNDVAVAVRDELTGELSFADQIVEIPR